MVVLHAHIQRHVVLQSSDNTRVSGSGRASYAVGGSTQWEGARRRFTQWEGGS
jgi:hypothetical protein